MSKCLSGSSILETNNGFKTLKDIQVGEYVNSPDGFVRVKRVVVYGVRYMHECCFCGFSLAPATITKDQNIFDTMEESRRLAFPGEPKKGFL